MRELIRRRVIVAALNIATYAALMWVAIELCVAATGPGWLAVFMAVCLALGTPWTVLGFWNALIGLWLLHGVRDPLARVAPYAAAGDEPTPVRVRVAILMTLRNEDPARAFRRLGVVKDSVDATGQGEAFAYFVLSDTNDPAIAAGEEAAFAAWQAGAEGAEHLHYRRRSDNAGFKAGNVRDFCQAHGENFELMLPLDADSLMSGAAIVRLVRMMQACPRLGILQSLVVGMPSHAAFGRIFQFGMRHGMRAYTMGQSWWTGDCGPFWGHNALVRIRPFFEHCALPVLPGGPPLGGHVLSHDQVEATLMRRAGYEVRVLPAEAGSWEENPPTIFEYVRRDLRWCQGNLQYLKLLGLPGLKAMSRFQLLWAILMFIGVPAWTLLIAALPFAAAAAPPAELYPGAAASALFVGFLVMFLMPKLAGLADIMLTRGGVRRYGGARRFAIGAVAEIVFCFLQGAVTTVFTALFMVGLAFGRSVSWSGQSRDAHALSWRVAASQLWPHFLFGVAVCVPLALIAPGVLYWSLPLTAGYLLAVPFAVMTASPALGRWLARKGICGVAEDFDPPPEVRAVQGAAETA